jgi:aryl-alcohol dehydrogenase-like predicted oxidoreductase
MRTDYLDLVQFHHSPSRAVLEEHDAVAELEDLRQEGKLRFIGMSGVLPHLPEQIEMGVFDAFQIPYSGFDREHEELISAAAEAGAGTIVRGGVARGVTEASAGEVELAPPALRAMLQKLTERFEQSTLDNLLDGMSRIEFLLRFTISHPDIHTTIVGTSSIDHLTVNVAAATNGPLPAELYELAKARLV